jgi:hypothetical protein
MGIETTYKGTAVARLIILAGFVLQAQPSNTAAAAE